MSKRKICLFDIDGTLTQSRLRIKPDMKQCLQRLKCIMDIALVGGSDAAKIQQQLDEETIALSNYFFSQNGLVAKRGQQEIHRQSIKDYLSEEKLQAFLNFSLHYIADLQIPVKRGTFIEYRTGMINISPIGRNCSQAEREAFNAYDNQHRVREKFIAVLKEKFADYNLRYAVGGQISFDVFPEGWDKTYCLRFLKDYDDIYFFGDKTSPGGNDHEIYELLRQNGTGYSVKEGPAETIALLQKIFLSNQHQHCK